MSEQTARSIKANKKMRDILQSNPTIDVDAFRLESIIAALEEWTGPDVDMEVRLMFWNSRATALIGCE